MSKPSNMKPDEAKSIIFEVYGNRGQLKAAADLRRGEVTVSRWLTGLTPIDTMSCMVLRLILVLHRKGCAWRKWVEEYETDEAPEVAVEDLL